MITRLYFISRIALKLESMFVSGTNLRIFK
nr:MAG TPA: hypothetical protein [Caudoviricetes sp.]